MWKVKTESLRRTYNRLTDNQNAHKIRQKAGQFVEDVGKLREAVDVQIEGRWVKFSHVGERRRRGLYEEKFLADTVRARNDAVEKAPQHSSDGRNAGIDGALSVIAGRACRPPKIVLRSG